MLSERCELGMLYGLQYPSMYSVPFDMVQPDCMICREAIVRLPFKEPLNLFTF